MAAFGRMGLILFLTLSCMAIDSHFAVGQQLALAPAPGSDCNSALLDLLPCLSFLTNSSVTLVSPACCSGLVNVSTASPACLCQYISPSNANQSAQLGINDTRALELPTFCKVNASPASCAAILGPSTAPVPSAVPVLAPSSTSPAPTTAVPSSTPALTPGSTVVPAPTADCTAVDSTLTPCLSFLTGGENDPSSDCCTNFGDVVKTSPSCLCSLVSSSGSSPISGLNVTLASELPSMCKVPVDLNSCSAAGAPFGSTEGPSSSSPNGNSGVRLAAGAGLYMVFSLAIAAIVYSWNELLAF